MGVEEVEAEVEAVGAAVGAVEGAGVEGVVAEVEVLVSVGPVAEDGQFHLVGRARVAEIQQQHTDSGVGPLQQYLLVNRFLEDLKVVGRGMMYMERSK